MRGRPLNMVCPVLPLHRCDNRKDGLGWHRYTDMDIGPPESHEKAKEVLAALAGSIIDREVEIRGLDFIDRERAKTHAERQLTEAYSQNY